MTELILHGDFETRSIVDLTKTTVDVYARHSTTDAWCLGYAFGNEPVEMWTRDEPTKHISRVKDHIASGGMFAAFNIYFEWNIWNKVMVPKYDWPELKIEQCICVQAMSYAMSLPGSLDKALTATGSPIEKDMAGHRLMLQMAKPRKIEDGTIIWWDDNERKHHLYEYCKPDVDGERWLYKRLRKLSNNERELWLLDHKINERGIPLDIPLIKTARNVSEIVKEQLDDEMINKTYGLVNGCSKIQQLKKHIKMLGYSFKSLGAPVILDILKDKRIPNEIKELLELRQKAGKTSTTKFQTMLTCASEDERVRYTMQYHGASTGRFAGRKIQPHNMPRPDPAFKYKSIEKGLSHINDLDYLRTIYGDPLNFISSSIRSMIQAKKDYDLIAGDFSAIESRKLAWLSNQENKLAIFRGDGKVYEHNAAVIYNKSIDDVAGEERQIGKVAELALGYQGAIGAFISMAKNYNLDVSTAFPMLWDTATPEIRKKAIKNYNAWRKLNPKADISKKGGIAADIIKQGWRAASPNTVQYWKDLENAAIDAVQYPGDVRKAGKIQFQFKNKHLWCCLPSGRVLCYPFAEIRQHKTPWGIKSSLSYMTIQKYQWVRIFTYGGMLAENVTQASSRCLLTDAMIRIERNGYPIVFHVHDEIISEIRKNTGSLDKFLSLLTIIPPWAKGLPLAADGWRGERFRK